MLLRRLARPLLASTFIYGGVQALRHPDGHAQAAAPVVDKVTEAAGGALPNGVPTDTTTLVRLDAVVKVSAGAALGLSRGPRLSATLLAASIVPTTLAAHRFWEHEDAEQRDHQRVQFLKNLGLLGGLLVVAADTAGKPSLGWRCRHGGAKSSD